MKQQNKQQNADAKVKIIPLGGLEQIGMNITAFELQRQYHRCGLRTGIPER